MILYDAIEPFAPITSSETPSAEKPIALAAACLVL